VLPPTDLEQPSDPGNNCTIDGTFMKRYLSGVVLLVAIQDREFLWRQARGFRRHLVETEILAK
jgi:hypothetical protein